jgi:hypothetical protein
LRALSQRPTRVAMSTAPIEMVMTTTGSSGT